MTESFPFPRRTPARLTFGLGMLLLGIFGFVPAVGVLIASFTDLRGLPGIPINFVGLQNSVDFSSPAKWADSANAVRNTIIFAVVSTAVQIVVALAVAVLLNRRLRGRDFYRAVVFMPRG